MLKTADFDFYLPQELIAQYPSGTRGEDRLLVLDRKTGFITHHIFHDIVSLVPKNALMVFNDSRVRKSRVHGVNVKTGRISEFLFIDKLDSSSTRWKAIVKNRKKHKAGMVLKFGSSEDLFGEVVFNPDIDQSEFLELIFPKALTEDWFEKNAHVPLPPYINRPDTKIDDERYQTIYAKITGSAACPTAGLHFTKTILDSLAGRGVETAFVTLHVGLGTFLPVRTEYIEQHVMHTETYSITAENAAKINAAKKANKPIVAVGTTSLRTLEAAFLACRPKNGESEDSESENFVNAGSAETNIFIYQENQFNMTDSLITNFHTPQSTLLMLVCAFAGKENILAAYAEAVKMGYKFFSYGEAMFITCS